MFEGILVRLRAFESSDLEVNHMFMNDYENQRTMRNGIPFPSSYEDERQWLQQQTSYTRGEYQFAVENFEGDLVGRCGVIKLDWKNRVAELAILIGKEYRHNGFGREAMKLLIDFCFREMNLHRLKVTVFEMNQSAVRLYQGCGFVQEGILRDEVFRDGKYRDVVVMGLINPAEERK